MNLKSILKALKLNESTISMALGIFVILAIGVIVINFFKGRSNSTPSIESGQTTESANEYTVEKGDTLWSISQKFYNDGFKWSEIAKANNIENPSTIEVGQKLTIPASAKAAEPSSSPEATSTSIIAEVSPTPEPSVESTTEPSPTPSQIVVSGGNVDQKITENTYTVVHGDNLWKIAVRAYGDGYKWLEIAKANNLKNPNIIHSGNVFTLPR
ncbi:LysM peptidoglycan-binding domain-containing protein [Candidatus Woesebacteria bacterium]|nr:LysM peptidoglycan-binding domain-containing protein [Candidatus Woesebacteria bacterium]QQG47154.1 MAG: LysM peptidoglycan-binding domain-containing protein [Candidatus Woesebacteria bacterium]